MLSAEENETLTLTGPDTPMGAVFRCYWLPALLSRELEAEGPPKRLRLTEQLTDHPRHPKQSWTAPKR